MKRLKDHKHILYVLKNCNPEVRKSILKTASPELIKTLCEMCINTLNGNTKITPGYKKKLKTYKSSLRKLVSPRLGIKSKKKILIQQGGFLPTLITALLSGVVGKIIENI